MGKEIPETPEVATTSEWSAFNVALLLVCVVGLGAMFYAVSRMTQPEPEEHESFYAEGEGPGGYFG